MTTFGSLSWSSSLCKNQFKSESVILSKNVNYLTEMFIDKERSHLQRNMRVADLKSILTLDEDFKEIVEARRTIYKMHPREVFQSNKDSKNFQASIEALQFISGLLSSFHPEKYKLEGPIPREGNFFNLKGDTLVSKETGERTALFKFQDEKHPLVTAGQLVTEDLVLSQPIERDGEKDYVMTSAFLATPTNWALDDFLNNNIQDIHLKLRTPKEIPEAEMIIKIILKTINGLQPVHNLFNDYQNTQKLNRTIIVRNNWFLKLRPQLRLLLEEVLSKEDIEAAKYYFKNTPLKEAGNHIFLRSEYESLTKLPSGFVLFTIRPFVFKLSDVVKESGMSKKILEGLSSRPLFEEGSEFLELTKNYLRGI